MRKVPKGQAMVEYLAICMWFVVLMLLSSSYFFQKTPRAALIEATRNRLHASEQLLRLPVP